MEHEQICQWLRDNSSGVYRPAAEAADIIEKLEFWLASANAKIEKQAARIRYLEGATNHATGTPLSKVTEERNKLAALVGTIRGMLDVPVRNVTDITVEEHSKEIGQAIFNLRLAYARLRLETDGLLQPLSDVQSEVPKETEVSGEPQTPIWKNVVIDNSLLANEIRVLHSDQLKCRVRLAECGQVVAETLPCGTKIRHEGRDADGVEHMTVIPVTPAKHIICDISLPKNDPPTTAQQLGVKGGSHE